MRYVELHCKTNFSFLEGASHADELVERAGQLGYAGLAITDRNSLAGIVRAYTATKDVPIKLIVGAELHPIDGPPVVAWAPNRKAYADLCRLLTVGRRRREKGACELTWQDFADHSQHLLAGILLRHPTLDAPQIKGRIAENGPIDSLGRSDVDGVSKVIGDLPRPAPQQRLFPTLDFDPLQDAGWLAWLHRFRELMGDRGYLLCELHRGVDDDGKLGRLTQLGRLTRLPLLASGDVHYHEPARSLLHDCVVAIRFGKTIDQIRSERLENSSYHLRAIDELRKLYRKLPAAMERTLEVADRCDFTMDQLRYEYPIELAPAGTAPIDHLKRLTWEGAKKRYNGNVPPRLSSCFVTRSA